MCEAHAGMETEGGHGARIRVGVGSVGQGRLDPLLTVVSASGVEAGFALQGPVDAAG